MHLINLPIALQKFGMPLCGWKVIIKVPSNIIFSFSNGATLWISAFQIVSCGLQRRRFGTYQKQIFAYQPFSRTGTNMSGRFLTSASKYSDKARHLSTDWPKPEIPFARQPSQSLKASGRRPHLKSCNFVKYFRSLFDYLNCLVASVVTDIVVLVRLE